MTKITILGWYWRSHKTGQFFYTTDADTADLAAANGEGDPVPLSSADALRNLCQVSTIADELKSELNKERKKTLSLTKQIRKVAAINRNIRIHLSRIRAK